MKINECILDSIPNIKEIRYIIELLGGDKYTKIVGGLVRDVILYHTSDSYVLNMQRYDVDLATKIEPNDVMRILLENNIKCLPIGIQYGTVHAIFQSKQYEITTLREDIRCDGRHATVKFTKSWKLDALRRDFTINSMFMSINGNIIDYCGGIADANARIVRFIGNPEDRINEDSLRILRYFRFCAQIKSKVILDSSLDAVKKSAYKLVNLSAERIWQEMKKLLSMQWAIEIIAQSIYIIGSYLSLHSIEIEKILHLKLSDSYIANLAAILRTSVEPEDTAKLIAKKWRLSKKDECHLTYLCAIKCMHTLEELHESKLLCHKQLFIMSEELYIHYVKLAYTTSPSKLHSKHFEEMLSEILAINNVPKLPISGYDIIKLGAQGEEVGKLLRFAQYLWLNSDFSHSKEKLLELLRDTMTPLLS